MDCQSTAVNAHLNLQRCLIKSWFRCVIGECSTMQTKKVLQRFTVNLNRYPLEVRSVITSDDLWFIVGGIARPHKVASCITPMNHPSAL